MKLIYSIIALGLMCQISSCDTGNNRIIMEKSKTLSIELPSESDNVPSPGKRMTLYLVNDNDILYYLESGEAEQDSLLTSATQAQLTDILLKYNRSSNTPTCDSTSDCKPMLVVIIKPMDVSYDCLMKVLDKMQIAGINKYAIDSLDAADSVAVNKFLGN